MRALDDKWLDSNLHCVCLSLDEILSYWKDIKKRFKLACNDSYHYLAEALYPVDISPSESSRSLAKLTNVVLPDDLRKIIYEPKTRRDLLRLFGLPWQLFILDRNSD